MTPNPILEELCAAREKLLADAGGDAHKYLEGVRERERASGRLLSAEEQRTIDTSTSRRLCVDVDWDRRLIAEDARSTEDEPKRKSSVQEAQSVAPGTFRLIILDEWQLATSCAVRESAAAHRGSTARSDAADFSNPDTDNRGSP